MGVEVIQWGPATVRVIKAYDIMRDDWITTLLMEHEDLKSPYVASCLGGSSDIERKMWFMMGKVTAAEIAANREAKR